MTWEPFALAVLFGLIVSGGLTFVLIWPRIEPTDPSDQHGDDEA